MVMPFLFIFMTNGLITPSGIDNRLLIFQGN
ncbi:MAG: hypothetical protein ACI9HU_002042, partial [Colwellia sp.]